MIKRSFKKFLVAYAMAVPAAFVFTILCTFITPRGWEGILPLIGFISSAWFYQIFYNQLED